MESLWFIMNLFYPFKYSSKQFYPTEGQTKRFNKGVNRSAVKIRANCYRYSSDLVVRCCLELCIGSEKYNKPLVLRQHIICRPLNRNISKVKTFDCL